MTQISEFSEHKLRSKGQDRFKSFITDQVKHYNERGKCMAYDADQALEIRARIKDYVMKIEDDEYHFYKK